MEAIEQTWNGQSGTNGRCTATISRNGDLVYRMYLEITGQVRGERPNPTSSLITDVELEIGGQKIDKHSGTWMEVWSELTEKNYNATIGAEEHDPSNITDGEYGTLFQRMSGMGGYGTTMANASSKFYVPLQFWFCRNPGLALPLIALQYHEVKVLLNHTVGTTFFSGENKLWADYIYLDTDERRRFAQVSHEYLIEQVQEQTVTTVPGNKDLNFNHPVKELIWVNASISNGQYGSSSVGSGNLVTGKDSNTFQLKLNGHDRFAARHWTYFTRTQVWEHHLGPGGLDATRNASFSNGAYNDSIAVYSFALKPEEHQPSGTCNFSRIDNAQLNVGGTCTICNIFAINYNVLRIMSGMGGLAYSN